MGMGSVLKKAGKKSCVSIFHQSRLSWWNAVAHVKIGDEMHRILLMAGCGWG